MKEFIQKLEQTKHGFKHIVEAGDKLLKNAHLQHLDTARYLLKDTSYQARMLATYLLGQLSTENNAALEILHTTVADDENWRVQEMLAKAFDQYCKTNGYQQSLPLIKEWLADKKPNVNRAVIEGLRIWTGRPYFKDHPAVAISLISKHKSSESEYVRKSVGNALRDIRKKYAALVDAETATWDLSNSNTAYTKKIVGKRRG